MSNKQICALGLGAVLLLGLSSVQADIRVRCEKRPDRSVISVDGSNLVAGSYRAVVLSGTHSKTSPLEPTIGDEVAFDFSSRPADIAAGAVPISVGFIRNGQVTGKLVNSRGMTVNSDTVRCRTR